MLDTQSRPYARLEQVAKHFPSDHIVKDDKQAIQTKPCCTENGREVKDSENGPTLYIHDRHMGRLTGPEPGKVLCFRSLRFCNRETDYWHMVQHMRGIRHFPHGCWQPKIPANGDGFGERITHTLDPVGQSIKKIAVMEDYEPLSEDEAAQFEQLFKDAFHGNLEAVEASFDTVEQIRAPKLNPSQPVGTIAANMGHLSVVDWVLGRGAIMDRELAMAIGRGSSKTAEMKAFYDENSEMLRDLTKVEPDPKYKSNVPYETIKAICETVKW